MTKPIDTASHATLDEKARAYKAVPEIDAIELADCQNEVSRCRALLDSQNRKIEQLQFEIADVKSKLWRLKKSHSWKLTRPFRDIRKVVLSRRLTLRPQMSIKDPSVNGYKNELSTLFDGYWYLARNPDVAHAGIDPLLHFLEGGWKEGRDPHPMFDTRYYLKANPDVASIGMNPLLHYIEYGAKEGRDPHPLFDTAFYLRQKPGIVGKDINPLIDYLATGPSNLYNPQPTEDLSPRRGVCVVTPDFIGPVKNGGIGTACYNYAVALVEAGYQVTVLFTAQISRGQTNHWRNHYAEKGITFLSMTDLPRLRHFTYGNTWFLETSERVLNFLATCNFDFVHFQDWQANGFWPIRAKRLGCALENSTLAVMMHSNSKWIRQVTEEFPKDAASEVKLEYCEAYCLRNCDVVISPSQYMFDWAATNSIALAAQRRLIPYLNADRQDDVQIIEPDPDHIIFFGRFETRKGLQIFAEALRRLKANSGNLPQKVSLLGKHATVYGVSSESFLTELAADLPEIKLTVISDFDAFQALDYIKRTRGLIVIASILDNYPYVVLECIDNGIPFIASSAGGIPEMVDPKILFTPTGIELAKALESRSHLKHETLHHSYSSRDARERWLALHKDSKAPELLKSETHQPRVSICIAYYNHGRYLENLIRSFERQNYPDFEVVVVNDGSTGDSAAEFERVVRHSKDNRFRFTTTANQGPAAARNLAASMSSGDHLLFFDSDNLPKDNLYVKRLVEALEISGADCVTAPYDIVDESCLDPSENDVLSSYCPLGACVEVGFFENIFGDTAMIVKKVVFDGLGGFAADRRTLEDHEFLLRLCLRGFQLEVFPQSLLYYRFSQRSRVRTLNQYHVFKNLMLHLASAPPPIVNSIVENLALPILLERQH